VARDIAERHAGRGGRDVVLALRGAVIRLFGKREVGQKLRESLDRLDAWARAGG
jgi:hypothetical protein